MKVLLAVDLATDATPVTARAVPWVVALNAIVDVLYASPDETGAQVDAVNALLETFPPSNRGVAHLVHGASPALTIAEQAQGFDVVAMGPSVNPATRSFWLGTVAERVVRSAPCSVLVLKEHAIGASPRILFTVDPNGDDVPAMIAVAAIARGLQARVDLMTVDEFAPGRKVEDPAWREMLDKQAASWTAEHLKILAEVRDKLPPEAQGEVFVDRGPAGDVIAERGAAYDLVVVSTHNRKGLVRMVLGSVAERVVRRCERPVLVVRT